MEMEYGHGGDIYSQAVELDYSSNINPLGLPQGVQAALAEGLGTGMFSAYPDSQCRELRKALGAYHQVPEEWILCGNGAAELIFLLADALHPRLALLPAPAFLEYGRALERVGCRTEYFLLEEAAGFVPDMERFCRRIAEGPGYDLVFFCNPNNPTGISAAGEDMRRLAQTCGAAGAFLAVDECFLEFLEDGEDRSLIPILQGCPDALIFRAFTKMYAMAGLRLGYCLSRNTALLEKMARQRQPWSVSGPAQAAGTAALKEEAYRQESRRLICREREFLEDGLRRLGFRVYASEANYLFFKDEGKRPGRWLYEALLSEGILIRSCSNYPGLDGSFYRICVRGREENERLIREIERVLLLPDQEAEDGQAQNGQTGNSRARNSRAERRA